MPSNTNYKNQRTNPGERPYNTSFRPPRSQIQPPSVKNTKCAWCTDNGLAHNHVTPDCAMLQNANAIDQWKVLFNHQLCDSCLLPGHHWRQCKNKAQDSCPNCGNSHHPNIGCRPQQRNSTYPDASWQFGPEHFTGIQGHTLFTQSFSRTCPVALHYKKLASQLKVLP